MSYPFYERWSTFHHVAWHVAATISLLASIASAGIAAIGDPKSYEGSLRIWLIVLPLVSGASASAMRLYKFREQEALREDGRIELNDIIRNARSLLAAAADEEACRVAYHEVRARFDKLERDQHRRDIALRDDEQPQQTNPRAP